jgi:hypothetical protein
MRDAQRLQCIQTFPKKPACVPNCTVTTAFPKDPSLAWCPSHKPHKQACTHHAKGTSYLCAPAASTKKLVPARTPAWNCRVTVCPSCTKPSPPQAVQRFTRPFLEPADSRCIWRVHCTPTTRRTSLARLTSAVHELLEAAERMGVEMQRPAPTFAKGALKHIEMLEILCVLRRDAHLPRARGRIGFV